MDGMAVIDINGSTYDIDYSHKTIPFIAYKNGKCVSGAVESQWIFSKTGGAVGSAALRLMLESHERFCRSAQDDLYSKISNAILSGKFVDVLWPILYPKSYCLSYLESGDCNRMVVMLMLLRPDCDSKFRMAILESTGCDSSTIELTQLLKAVVNEHR